MATLASRKFNPRAERLSSQALISCERLEILENSIAMSERQCVWRVLIDNQFAFAQQLRRPGTRQWEGGADVLVAVKNQCRLPHRAGVGAKIGSSRLISMSEGDWQRDSRDFCQGCGGNESTSIHVGFLLSRESDLRIDRMTRGRTLGDYLRGHGVVEAVDHRVGPLRQKLARLEPLHGRMQWRCRLGCSSGSG